MAHRVLLVEHDRRVALALEATLEAAGVEVVGRATHLDDALQKVARLEPDLALVDVAIPGDGLVALSSIASDGTAVVLLAADEAGVERAGARAPVLRVNAGAPRFAVAIELACRERGDRQRLRTNATTADSA